MRNRAGVMRWGTSVVASALFATLLVLTGITGRVEVPIHRSAGVTDLCSGWSGCNSAGYSDAGYGAVSGRMYWNMYAGHNCTNYVAYRMIKAGMSTTRPWVGGGNASEWGLQMRSITDQVPSVGSVAWWGRYSNGSGSAGHVGYVERVVSPNEIIISMDSWGGTFHWRRITKDSGRWPTGFIHFTDKKLTATVAPAVSGTAQVGTVLQATAGTWSPTAERSVQWLANGVALPGRTGLRLAVTPDLLGKTIAAKVTGNRTGYKPVTVTSKATKAVAPGVITPSEPPVLSGEPFVDGTLTATPGRWNVAGTAVEWRWYADDVRVRANGGPTLALTPAYDGKTIKVVAVARKVGYKDAAAPATAKAGPVLAGKITVSRPVSITGTRRVGYQLLAAPGAYDPTTVTASYQWLRNGVPIPGATGIRYVQTPADVGRVLTVRTSLSKARYIPATTTAASTQRTQAVPTIAVTPIGLKGSAVVSLRVTAPGANPVVGWVDVTVGRHTRTVQLGANGIARVSIDDLAAGSRDVRVYYRGSTVALAKRWNGSVVVK